MGQCVGGSSRKEAFETEMKEQFEINRKQSLHLNKMKKAKMVERADIENKFDEMMQENIIPDSEKAFIRKDIKEFKQISMKLTKDIRKVETKLNTNRRSSIFGK